MKRNLPRLVGYAPYDGMIRREDVSRSVPSREILIREDGLNFTILTDWADGGDAGEYVLNIKLNETEHRFPLPYRGVTTRHLAHLQIRGQLPDEPLELDVQVLLDDQLVGTELLIAKPSTDSKLQ